MCSNIKRGIWCIIQIFPVHKHTCMGLLQSINQSIIFHRKAFRAHPLLFCILDAQCLVTSLSCALPPAACCFYAAVGIIVLFSSSVKHFWNFAKKSAIQLKFIIIQFKLWNEKKWLRQESKLLVKQETNVGRKFKMLMKISNLFILPPN